MSNATILYRVIKAIQGFIIFALGLIICIFFNNADLKDAIGYCLATVTLIYGLLTIAFSYLFQRGIASFDMISGVILMAISLFIYLNPSIINEFLPLFFGCVVLIYSVILLIELIINILHKNIKKIVIYSLTFVLFLAIGILITIFAFQQQKFGNYVVLVIGIILLCIGLFLIFFSLTAPKKDILVTENSLINSTKKIESKNEITTTQKIRNSKKKSAKSQQNLNKTDVLEIEDKSNNKDDNKN